jgi:ribosomal protein L11 methyltransferase
VDVVQTTKPLFPDTILHIYCLKGHPPQVSDGPCDFLGTWEEDGYSFLFFLRPRQRFVDTLLETCGELELTDYLTMTYRQWQGDFVEPLKIGRFVLTPPWLKRVPAGDEIGLRFDPGLVFGNGTHPTTLACLTAIEIVCGGASITRMLDLGTGSGLLALAAARLGCSRVVAVDNNMLAARTARANVMHNGLEAEILVACGRAQHFVQCSSELLVANIGFRVLGELVADAGLSAHRWLVLSGLNQAETEALLPLLEDNQILLLKRWQSEEKWNTLLCITQFGR